MTISLTNIHVVFFQCLLYTKWYKVYQFVGECLLLYSLALRTVLLSPLKMFNMSWSSIQQPTYFLSPFSSYNHRLLDSLLVECWLQGHEVPGSIPSQGPRHTKDVIKMVPVVPLFGTRHCKGKHWLFLKN